MTSLKILKDSACLTLFLKYNPKLKPADLSQENAKSSAEKMGIKVKDNWGLGKIQIEIFEKTVEDQLIQPTFITHYPTEVSPLSRRNDEDPFVTDRFELFIGGREIANGFSELNDPEDQAQRFREQATKKMPEMMKPCIMMLTISVPWNMVCLLLQVRV